MRKILEHFYGFYLSIGRTFAKIRVEMCHQRLWNRFYHIHRTFLNTLVAILSRSDVILPRYRGNVSSQAFKTVLRHLRKFFEHFCGSFTLIRCTVAKILSKTCLPLFPNRFYTICTTFLSTLVAIFFRSDIPLPRHGWNGFLWVLKEVVRLHHSFLRTLIVILRRLDEPLQKNERKRFLRNLKLVLQHSPNVFEHFGCYFCW